VYTTTYDCREAGLLVGFGSDVPVAVAVGLSAGGAATGVSVRDSGRFVVRVGWNFAPWVGWSVAVGSGTAVFDRLDVQVGTGAAEGGGDAVALLSTRRAEGVKVAVITITRGLVV